MSLPLLRHALATLAYRGDKVMSDVPRDFSTFKSSGGTRTPGEILAHIGDLFDWAISIVNDEPVWRERPPQAWEADVARFHDGLTRLDALLASDTPVGASPEKLFQGPIADALTHVGQIAMLRRMAGAPIKGENYFKAKIQIRTP